MLVSLLGWSLVAFVGYVLLSKSVRRYVGPGGVTEETEDSWAPEIREAGKWMIVACSIFGGAWGAATLGRTSGAQTPGGVSYGAPNAPNVNVTITDTSTWIISGGAFVGSGDDTHDSTQIQVDRNGGNFSSPLTEVVIGAQTTDTLTDNADWKADTTYIVRMRYKGAAAKSATWSAYDSATVLNATWPNNEPASMTTLVSGNGSSKTFGITPTFTDAPWNNADSVAENITDAGSRYGTVVRKIVSSGYGSEWHGILTCNNCSAWSTAYQEVYFRWIERRSANYDTHSSGEKFFYFGNGGTGSADDYWVGMKSTREVIIFNQAGLGGFTQLDTGDTFTLNAYHTFEMRIRGESSVSANDGIITLWLDNTQIYTNTSVDWGSSGATTFKGFQVWAYWGGSGDTKTATDSIFLSELYMSGKN